jgi:3-deoxy-D-manno-octulosonic-acid transferase
MDDLVASVVTPGGHEVASKWVGNLVSCCFYAPFDAPGPARRALAAVEPEVLAIMETEIWPNLLHLAACSGVRTALLNGRISDRSYPKYRRIRPLMRWALGHFDRILAQSATDADRLIGLGAPAALVEIAGNTKFDQAAAPLPAEEAAALKSSLGFPPEAPVFVVGSTRSAQEEELTTRAYLRMREQIPNLALLHAPRHTERAEEVTGILRAARLEPRLRSDGASDKQGPLILNTFGELAKVYAVADVVFMGNSLTPPGGGQNPLQPLAQGKPVLFGPHMSNFRDIASRLTESGLATVVSGPDELAQACLSLLARTEAERSGHRSRALKLLDENRGAAERCAATIAGLMSHRQSSESMLPASREHGQDSRATGTAA